MFTGVIEEMGTLSSVETVDAEWGAGVRISISARLSDPYRP